MRWSVLTLTALLPLSAQACPDLQSFYRYGSTAEEQRALESALSPLMAECLRSSEYFALYGAAQMENGNLAEALEMLERALLLDPANGAAQIDYAQALYLRGQLFSALDLNRQILARSDVPANILQELELREKRWRAQTRQIGVQADVLAGYDNNLNGAPEPSQITLTLSGEPIVLTLNPEYRPVSGPYLNLRVGGLFRQQAPDHHHQFTGEIRGRASEDTGSDLIQLETRYQYVRPERDHTWQFGGAMSHLFFGGSALYSAVEGNGYYVRNAGDRCSQRFGLAAQFQHYTSQSFLNAVESKLSGGYDCQLDIGGVTGAFRLEASLLNNAVSSKKRPGGDRNGWQMTLDWQQPYLGGVLGVQINHTRLRDDVSYSALLENGARRWLKRSFVLGQYRHELGPKTAIMLNLYHQKQSSNIALFDSIDTTVELGVNIRF